MVLCMQTNGYVLSWLGALFVLVQSTVVGPISSRLSVRQASDAPCLRLYHSTQHANTRHHLEVLTCHPAESSKSACLLCYSLSGQACPGCLASDSELAMTRQAVARPSAFGVS